MPSHNKAQSAQQNLDYKKECLFSLFVGGSFDCLVKKGKKEDCLDEVDIVCDDFCCCFV